MTRLLELATGNSRNGGIEAGENAKVDQEKPADPGETPDTEPESREAQVPPTPAAEEEQGTQ
jgi:hypothetical protein